MGRRRPRKSHFAGCRCEPLRDGGAAHSDHHQEGSGGVEMIQELSPATRQHIIDTAHRDGHYAATHGGLRMEVTVYSIPNTAKLGVALKVCLDRRWKTFTVDNVFAAVDLWGGRTLKTHDRT